MLAAGGRAPPFGDLGDGATAAGADAGTIVQRANIFAGRWWPFGHISNQFNKDEVVPLLSEGHFQIALLLIDFCFPRNQKLHTARLPSSVNAKPVIVCNTL